MTNASDPEMKLLKETLNVYFEKMSGMDKRNMSDARITVEVANLAYVGRILEYFGGQMGKFVENGVATGT